MARASKSNESAVTLFPFLAVLVCVMGSLIFLLLATTKRMHDIAVAEAEAQWAAEQAPPAVPEPSSVEPEISVVEALAPDLGSPVVMEAAPPAPDETPDLEEQNEKQQQEWRSKLASLERRRDELQNALQKQRAVHQTAKKKVDALKDATQESQTKLRGMLALIETQKNTLSPKEDLAELEQQIIELRKKLRLLQNRSDEGQTKFTVLPFDVRSGTTRRPLLIECTDHGLRFLPEDITIKPSDLEGFTEQYNPLLAGARALTDYWTAWNMRQAKPDDKPEPYVLLIVRPNGTVAYYVAMRMLSSLKQPHGYELVDESIDLAPPAVDPEAQRLCREAVERQLAERAEIMQQVRNGFRSGTGSGNGSGNGTGNGQFRGGKPRSESSDTFQVSDVAPPGEKEIGERSWENIDRFEGTRPKKNSQQTGGTTAGRSSAPGARSESTSPNREGSPGGVAARNQPAGQGIRKSPGSSQPGGDENVTTASESEEQLPTSNAAGTPGSSRKPRDSYAEAPTPSRRSGPSSRMSSRPGRGNGNGNRNGQSSNNGGGDLHLAQLGRRHWGQSEPGASIGIEQDVTVRVDAQQMVVANNRVVRCPPGAESIDLFLHVMEAVDAESQTWGKPRPGFYWTPRLKFVVSPGGNQLFERIDPLTIRSGLSTTREFTLEGVSPAKSEGRP